MPVLIKHCLTCMMHIQIFMSPQGECLEIEIDGHAYPCVPEVMRETGCFDDDGSTLLCDADWIWIST
jgi:hypothetical protein